MVVCCSAGGWFGRCRGQWFGRFLRQLGMGSNLAGVSVFSNLTLGRFPDAFFASYNCFLWIPKVTGSILCWHYGGWFGRFPGQWFGRFPGQLHLFFMDSKGDGRHFWNVLFSGRLGPVYMVVCCSAGGWFGRCRGQWFGRFPGQWFLVTLVFYGFQRFLRWFGRCQLDAFLASGLDAFLASYTCFLWIPKVTGGIFETFCFPVVLALCLWWFAVAQAAGLDAVVASGLDAFFASYNCFLWIPKVTGSILCWLRRLVWTLSWPVVWTLSWPVTLVFYGFQRWREAFLKRSVFRSSWPCVYGDLM